MPTNLPPEYYDVEERYRTAETVAEKIIHLEEMLSVIPKHKGTDRLRADLRRKLSKLKDAAAARKGGSRQVSPYHIDREGVGQVAVVGAANVGKSSLIAALTNAEPDIADYPYTTAVPMPGMMPVDNIQVQLIDTPPLSAEFEEPQLMDLIRRSDLIALVIDLQAHPIQQLEDSIALLEKYRIIPDHLKDQYPDQRRLTFKPLLVLVNKTDDEQLDADFAALCDLLKDEPCPLFPISAAAGRYLEQFKQMVFERLDIVRIYSKPPGKDPNLDVPFVMKRGGTVMEFAAKVHQDFADKLKSARVWGDGVYDGQKVGRDHVLHDGDVVELRT
ncbi:MAG: TGS domain-containing protein [Anaerolineae bacterium]|jgi:ribosome-interacting GTPase 1|nr:TGS domain-containing protein [Anaerolineae bacterium]